MEGRCDKTEAEALADDCHVAKVDACGIALYRCSEFALYAPLQGPAPDI